MKTAIIRDGNNLIVGITVLDSNNQGVSAGIVVEASVQNLRTGNYWNVASKKFDLFAEPSLSSFINKGNGLYEDPLLNAALPITNDQ